MILRATKGFAFFFFFFFLVRDLGRVLLLFDETLLSKN
jgi:hypothetical protein